MYLQIVVNILSRFRKAIVVFIIFVGFFIFYNTFLIDYTIESLKFSLEQTASAYDVNDLDGLDLLLNQIMAEEIMPKDLNLMSIANIEYVRNSISAGKGFKAIDSIKRSLNEVIKDRESKRWAALRILDSINRFLNKIFIDLFVLVNRAGTGKEGDAASKVGAEIFKKAGSLEKEGKLVEALAGYNKFIAEYPAYEKIGLVKLRTANLFQRTGQLDKAIPVYREVIRRYVGKKESYIAQTLLRRLQQIEDLSDKANRLLANFTETKKEDVKTQQEIFYQLGMINLKILNMDEAKKFFKRTVALDPQSEIAAKAKFNSAWANKEDKNYAESIKEFSDIIKENPKAILALDSRYQIADAYHKEGRYQEAIDTYIKLAEDYKGDPISALCLFQAGASYLYDLNDDQKATEVFDKLTKEYPKSPYAKYVAPDNPIGIFITYLVPRATRVVAWRAGGLIALAGYSGEIAKFKQRFEEKSFNEAFNEWLRQELPDTIGNLYVNVLGSQIEFKKSKARSRAKITMGKFSIMGDADWKLEETKDNSIALSVTRVMLEKIPILPMLINNSLSGLYLMAKKNFPIVITKVSMNEGEIDVEGYGSERMLKFLRDNFKGLMGKVEVDDIKDPAEKKELYDDIVRRFPGSDFTPNPKDDTETLFIDFFTRMNLYMGFKILETVKDTKLDYERSIRTLGRLSINKGKFRVTYTEAAINSSLARLIYIEFPLIIGKEFLFDVKGLEVHFASNGDIKFSAHVSLGRVHFPIRAVDEVQGLMIEGRAYFDIDKDTKIPRLVFKEVFLNSKPFPVDKLNFITLRVLNLLKYAHIPFQLDKLDISEGAITLQGEGARDFTERIFSDPHLFVIFQIREWDLGVAGILRLKDRPENAGDYWRGGVQKDNRKPEDRVFRETSYRK